MKQKAFTLAEIMIVLTIIAIITAILLPAARNAMPNENVMKFKKGHNALNTAISELVNSDKYHFNGDLGLKPDGSLVDDSKYFCNALADIMSVKKVNCSDDNLGYNSSAVANLAGIGVDELDGEKIQDLADCMCLNNVSAGEEIVLSDGSVIYSVNPYYHFGSKTESGGSFEGRIFNPCSKEQRYKYVCIDIDGIGKGEAPFGYALRVDGKMFSGSRALAWLNKNVQEKEDGESEAISSIDSCSAKSLAIVPENETCSAEKPKNCGELAMKVNLDGVDYCITKYNIGDKTELPIPSGVTTASAGSDSCTPSESNLCCWVGTTSTFCDSNNGGYSGCTRTVCDWRAANKICESLTYLNKSWQLPTSNEWSLIGAQLNSISIGQGSEGLMLCDDSAGCSSASCSYAERCSGSYNGYCTPHDVWSGTSSGSSSAYNYYLRGGVWYGPHSGSVAYAFSVRCISKL